MVVEASIRACRLEPFPEMSTVIFVGGGLCMLRDLGSVVRGIGWISTGFLLDLMSLKLISRVPECSQTWTEG